MNGAQVYKCFSLYASKLISEELLLIIVVKVVIAGNMTVVNIQYGFQKRVCFRVSKSDLEHVNLFQCKSAIQDCSNLISAYMSPTTYGSLILSKNGRSVF